MIAQSCVAVWLALLSATADDGTQIELHQVELPALADAMRPAKLQPLLADLPSWLEPLSRGSGHRDPILLDPDSVAGDACDLGCALVLVHLYDLLRLAGATKQGRWGSSMLVLLGQLENRIAEPELAEQKLVPLIEQFLGQTENRFAWFAEQLAGVRAEIDAAVSLQASREETSLAARMKNVRLLTTLRRFDEAVAAAEALVGIDSLNTDDTDDRPTPCCSAPRSRWWNIPGFRYQAPSRESGYRCFSKLQELHFLAAELRTQGSGSWDGEPGLLAYSWFLAMVAPPAWTAARSRLNRRRFASTRKLPCWTTERVRIFSTANSVSTALMAAVSWIPVGAIATFSLRAHVTVRPSRLMVAASGSTASANSLVTPARFGPTQATSRS